MIKQEIEYCHIPKFNKVKIDNINEFNIIDMTQVGVPKITGTYKLLRSQSNGYNM